MRCLTLPLLMSLPLLILAAVDSVTLGGKPTTSPADATVDWLMNQPATAPALPTTSTTQHSTPFTENDEDRALPGMIILSDSSVIRGHISTTPEKPLRIWDEQQKEYQDVPLSMIRSADADVLWERDEKEWRFKASGSDVKEYSGKTYPARETKYKFTLTDGRTIEGGVVAPLYITTVDGKTLTLVLHKRDKGDAGQTREQLIYVKRFEINQ